MSNPLLWSAFSTDASVLSVIIWSITHSVDSFSGEYVRISNCGFFEISLWLVKGIFSSIYSFREEKIASPLVVLSGCGIIAIIFPSLLHSAAIL